MYRFFIVVFALSLLAPACGAGTTTAPGFADLLETVEETAPGPDALTPPPDAAADVAADAPLDFASSPELPDLHLQDAVEVGPGPGEVGAPCKSDSECLSGFCIPTPDGYKCTTFCQEECPFDWQCVLSVESLPDTIFICVPAFVSLCKPCHINDDCHAGGGDVDGKCVEYGPEGSFCTVPCESQGACPDGYECLEAPDVTGAMVTGCLFASPQCQCTQYFADEGASTSCVVQNEFGACHGERKCLASGLSDCDAQVPSLEVCNGQDEDCDGDIDEELHLPLCSKENGFGLCEGSFSCIGGTLFCDAEEPKPEACDGVDNNCDGEADEGYKDTDADGVKDCLEVDKDGDGVDDEQDNCEFLPNPDQEDFDFDGTGDACDQDDDNDLVPDGDDCAPLNQAVHPGQDEKCNGFDDDCDEEVDEGFDDIDGNGIADCAEVDTDKDGWPDGADCAPEDPAIFPGAAEECDGADNDCNGKIDEGYDDFDQDGQADCVDDDMDDDAALNNVDCDPLDPVVYPGAPELCDGKDNDCDFFVDEGHPDTDSDGLPDCVDDDDDADFDPDVTDCAPLDAAIHAAALEMCDGVDNNCNDKLDEGFGASTCGVGVCEHAIANCKDGELQQCEPMEGAGDEQCDGLDNDCNGKVDDGLGTTTCGQGICEHTVVNCVDGQSQQCDPMEGAGDEVCDLLDNDCNGEVDEGQAGACTLYFSDDDEDGWGVGDPVCLCQPEAPYTALAGGDCNDDAGDVNPGASEECGDGVDNDCNPDTLCSWVEQDGEKWEISPYEGSEKISPFYQYGSPAGSSSNTGLEAKEKAQFLIYEEPGGDLYLILILDKPSNSGGGKADVQFTGLYSALPVVIDDPGETSCNPDPVAGTALCNWHWSTCCTDGGAFGPLGCGTGDFEITATFTKFEGMNGIIIRNGDGSIINLPATDKPITIAMKSNFGIKPPILQPSCKAILDAGFSKGSGVYWIDPDGGDSDNALEVFCDMETNGGGWTMCGKFDRDNAGGASVVPAGFGRAPIFPDNLSTVAGFCTESASIDCRQLIEDGATQMLNAGANGDGMPWADGRIIDLPAEIADDPTNLWDIALDEDQAGQCVSDIIITRDLDGNDLGNNDNGASLSARATLMGNGALFTSKGRPGANFSNAGQPGCSATSYDTVFWSWADANGGLDNHACGATGGHLQLGTGCDQSATWRKPTYRYNLLFFR